MLVIEPLSQSDRANFPTVAFQTNSDPKSGGTFLLASRRKETSMSTNLTRSVAPTMEICPKCESEMRITEVTPILFDDGLENITYRCKGCGLEMKRAFKRRSGAWQPIRHTPEFPSVQRCR
jgi:transcription elongation factor Elf1